MPTLEMLEHVASPKAIVPTAALVAALLVQVVHGVPAYATAVLRAMTCCAHGCDHGRSLPDAMRCCGVQPRDEVAAIPAVTKLAPPLVAHVAPALASTRGAPLAAFPADMTPRRERAAPLFLLVRSLRL